MASIRWGAVVTAACGLATACGQGSGSTGGTLGTRSANDGGAGRPDASSLDGSSPAADGQAGDDGGEAAPDGGAPSNQALVRIANFAPDAPAAGYDVCLAPAGSMNWMGPLLGMSFAAGALGQGGANGIQFPWVTAYFPVAPGSYDLQLIAAGGSCTGTGILPPTYGLPALVAGSRTTFAVVGDVMPRGADANLKVTAFNDDATASGGAALRVINAIPTVGYVDVGTGSGTAGTFSPIFTAIAFGMAATSLPDGGAPDNNGYVTIAPLSGVELSAHPSGMAMANTATASNVTLAAGSVTTMVLVNGNDGGRPPQFLSCTDGSPPRGAQSACTVIPQ